MPNLDITDLMASFHRRLANAPKNLAAVFWLSR